MHSPILYRQQVCSVRSDEIKLRRIGVIQMKKIIVLLAAAAILAACGDNENQTAEQSEEQSEETADSPATSFQQLDVTGEGSTIHITGQAKTEADRVYYRFEQGDDTLVEETPIELGKNAQEWSDFELDVQITEAIKESEEVPLVILYGKNENGENVNENHVPIDLGMLDNK